MLKNPNGTSQDFKLVIVHLGQYWRFYFPCFLGTRGGRSPTPSAQKAGRKTNNVARGAHIAYCTEGKTRVFHQSVMKSCQKTKNGKKLAERASCFFSAKRQKKKCACFFLPDLRLFSLLGGKIVGKPGTRGKINDRKI